MSSTQPTRSELRAALGEYDGRRIGVKRYRYLERSHAPKRPAVRELELRSGEQTGDGSFTIQGHAAVTGQTTVLFDIGWLRVSETISAGAFNKVLASDPDVHGNINHDMKRVMARTGVDGVGGLKLNMDGVGLADFMRVDPAISYVADLGIAMKAGIIDQQSFAFTIADETRTEVDDGETVVVTYEIQEIGDLFDVCVCAQGAYPTTDASLRGLVARVSGHAGSDLAGHPEGHGSPGAQTDGVAPIVGARTNELAIAKAQAVARSSPHKEFVK